MLGLVVVGLSKTVTVGVLIVVVIRILIVVVVRIQSAAGVGILINAFVPTHCYHYRHHHFLVSGCFDLVIIN